MSKYQIQKDYNNALMHTEDVLGAGVTNNAQLDKLCFSLFRNDYLGTFSADQFPRYVRNGQCFILNTDSSRSANRYGHWVAFCKSSKNGKIYYYDSYARPASELSIYWKNKRIINANKNGRDQSFKSSICGSMSVSFLIVFKKYGERCVGIV